MYHVELRQFPHNMCRFNLSEGELFHTVVEGWAQEKWIEFGERKWNPHEARLTVLEGPHLEVEQLAMGRGWRNAQRHGEDVTERVLEQARARRDAQAVAASEAGVALVAGDADGQLLALLGADPEALLASWRLTVARRPELAPSEALALAETTLQSLDVGEG
ncbi:MAG TPA: hypothetical protein VGL54_06295 [Solirubrobacteraceae bacterium]|jgi:hypothetical protein